MMRRVFVLISGGVDSSVAAALLKEEGFDVVGAHLKCWSRQPQTSADHTQTNAEIPRQSVFFSPRESACTAEQDAEDARRVADKLKIPFHVFDFEKEYREAIFNEMLAGYRRGITPNPDVGCNSRIKFGFFFEKAISLGADYVATGHYAKIIQNLKGKNQNYNSKFKNGKPSAVHYPLLTTHYQLLTAADAAKDQTYFLWQIKREQLPKILFPIGEYQKSEVRELARKFNLSTAEKKDSQGLCFVGKVDFLEFLKEHLPPSPGPIYDIAGAKIGEHEGAQYVTVGQRHGLNIQNGRGPYYVAAKDVSTNTVVVAREGENSLYQKEAIVSSVNWLIDYSLLATNYKLPLNCEVRVRYRQPLVRAALTNADLTLIDADNLPRKSALGSASVRVVFDAAQKGVAPGQSAVFYRDGAVLGGGIIK